MSQCFGFCHNRATPGLNPHPPERVPAQCAASVIHVTVDKGNHVLRPLYNVRFRMKPGRCHPRPQSWLTSLQTPWACAPVRRAWVQRLGLRPQAERWGPLSREGQGHKENLSRASTNCDPGQVTAPLGILTPKGQQNLSRIGSEERLSLRGGLVRGEPPGAVRTLLPQLSHPHPIPAPKP